MGVEIFNILETPPPDLPTCKNTQLTRIYTSSSMDGGDNCTLLIRKLPGWLKTEDKESLLKHFGALEVTVMSNKGSMVREQNDAL